jgi:hypothetical protein
MRSVRLLLLLVALCVAPSPAAEAEDPSSPEGLPRPRPGWTADAVERRSWSGPDAAQAHRMIHARRVYRREADGAVLDLTLTNWPELVEATRAGLDGYRRMAALLEQDPRRSLRVEERGGWTVLQVTDHEAGTVQMRALAEGYLVGMDLDRDEPAVVDAYLEALDPARPR